MPASIHGFVCTGWVDQKTLRRRQTLYDVASLLLMVPMALWQNSTPFFGALALCTTEIDNFRRRHKNVNEPKNEDDLKNENKNQKQSNAG